MIMNDDLNSILIMQPEEEPRTNKLDLKSIAVIGHVGTGSMAALIQQTKDLGFTVISSEMAQEEILERFNKVYPQPEPIPFVIKPLPELTMYVGEGKPFKCKGKHQYRHVDTEVIKEGEYGTITMQIWRCECGRNIND